MKEIWFIALTWTEMFKENDLIKVFFIWIIFVVLEVREILLLVNINLYIWSSWKSKGRTSAFPLVLLKDANIFYLFESNLLDQG